MNDNQNTKALAIVPKTFEESVAMAESLAKSSLLPKEMRDKMPNVLVTILAGQELGLAPMAALRSFHVIEGKPVLSSDGMVAIVMRSGACVYFRRVAADAESVTYETLRVGTDKPQKCTWTLEMARKASLHQKDNWRCYPRQMLAARAKAELARDVYDDVLAGCYVEDEMTRAGRSVYDGGGDDIADAEIVSEAAGGSEAPKISLLDAIDQAPNAEALGELAPKLAQLKGREMNEARTRYKARVVWFREQAAQQASDAVVAAAAEAPAADAKPASAESAPEAAVEAVA